MVNSPDFFFFLNVGTHTSNSSDLLLVCRALQGGSEVAVPAQCRMLTRGNHELSTATGLESLPQTGILQRSTQRKAR